MNGAFYIAATGLDSQQRALEALAHNIANVNTVAYKRSLVQFSELVSAPSGKGGGGAAGLLQGVACIDSQRDFSQGDLKTTGKSIDLAINGEGFIELMGPAGQVMLWRGGGLKVNADGALAADNGMALKANINVPMNAGPVSIGADGKVTAPGPDGRVVDLGQIDLVRVKDASTLKVMSGGLYATANPSDVTASAPGADGFGTLVQGALEGSNTQLSEEMVALLLTQRSYAANAQLIQASDQLMSIVNDLRR